MMACSSASSCCSSEVLLSELEAPPLPPPPCELLSLLEALPTVLVLEVSLAEALLPVSCMPCCTGEEEEDEEAAFTCTADSVWFFFCWVLLLPSYRLERPDSADDMAEIGEMDMMGSDLERA